MRHHFAITRCDRVDGVSGDMRASCSCGWTLDEPSWHWPKDGYDVYDLAWPAFQAHVESLERHVRCWHLSGWYPNIAPNDRRASNLSNGAVFSTKELGLDYVRRKLICLQSLKPVMLDPADPQIDFALLTWAEQCELLDRDSESRKPR